MGEQEFQEQEERRRLAETKKERYLKGIPEPEPPKEYGVNYLEQLLIEKDGLIRDLSEKIAELTPIASKEQQDQLASLTVVLDELKREFTKFTDALLAAQKQHKDRVEKTLDRLDGSL